MRMISVFKSELSQETVVLTPRDLHFALFGGRELHDSLIEQGKNPWEVFEFGLAGMGNNRFPQWGADYWSAVSLNFSTLFSN